MNSWRDEYRSALESWAGTPYMHGQGMRGVASDCIGFVAGVLDEMHGLALPPPRRHAPDLAWHNRRLAAQITLEISERWPHVLVRDHALWVPEPGDVLICRVGQSPTGHVMLVGLEAGVLWHCDTGCGVDRAGIETARGRLIRIWRPTEKKSWRRRS